MMGSIPSSKFPVSLYPDGLHTLHPLQTLTPPLSFFYPYLHFYTWSFSCSQIFITLVLATIIITQLLLFMIDVGFYVEHTPGSLAGW